MDPPSAQQPKSFAIDLDLVMLEKEIERREREARGPAGDSPSAVYGDLGGSIGQAPQRQSKTAQQGDFPSQPSANAYEYNTLDEPIWDTINRDLRVVRDKFTQVLLPGSKQNVLKDWDLWGPLFICVFLSLLLQGSTKGPQFTQMFVLAFFGSFAVTLNIKLLGGKISFLQTLCLIGYCLLPCVLAALGIKLVWHLVPLPSLEMSLRMALTVGGFAWATFASKKFLAGTLEPGKSLLGYYPLFLFYFVVSWLVITNA